MKIVNVLIILVGSFLIGVGLYGGRANSIVHHTSYKLDSGDWTMIAIGSLIAVASIAHHRYENRRRINRRRNSWTRG